MYTRQILIPAVAMALFAGSLTSLAQDTGRGGHPGTKGEDEQAPRTSEQMKEGGMMDGDMMRMCHQMMMGGRMRGQMGAMMMPHLPPGNEKLELQMRAEMMRKMAEVMEKYAGQIRQSESSPQN